MILTTNIKQGGSQRGGQGGHGPPNILPCLASKVVQVVYVSPECPVLALKSCLKAQNTLKFEDFYVKSQKISGGKASPRKNFFGPPISKSYLPPWPLTYLSSLKTSLGLGRGKNILHITCFQKIKLSFWKYVACRLIFEPSLGPTRLQSQISNRLIFKRFMIEIFSQV